MVIPLLPASSHQGRRSSEMPVRFLPLGWGRIEERGMF
jgi:hypothetical protein